MDPLTAFLIFAALLALDVLLGQTWQPLYFRFGLPVYVLRASADRVPGSSLEQAAHALEQRFTARPQHPSIRFKALGSGLIALREALLENRGGFKYLPVMHSSLRLDPQHGRLALTGYINFYALFVILYLVYRSLTERAFIPVAILVLVVLAISYAAQAGINAQVAREVIANDRPRPLAGKE